MKPSRAMYLGLFLAALASVALELILTRIFSVTSYYHFAFVAVSLAMFGITAGAVATELRAGRGGPEGDRRRLSRVAFWYGPGAVVALAASIGIPFRDPASARDVAVLGLTYLLEAVPFFFCGALTSLVLRAHPRHVGRLYAADLVGAATGCALVIPLLDTFNGPAAALAMAAVAALSAVVLSWEEAPSRARAGVVAAVLLAVLVADANTHFIRIYWDKEGHPEGKAPWEKWNAYSRVRVRPWENTPFGWGLSPRMPPGSGIRQMWMDIDSAASTVMTASTGNRADWDYMKWDITAAGHWLVQEPVARVLSLGVGGGRDLLTALAFGKRSVTGVEINQAILDADLDAFGAFTGPLDRLPGVRLENDEARSWVARSDEKFDLMVMSLTDTAAASSAGAYVLTENSLYTKEAIGLFLDRLSDKGVLSITRWHDEGQPAEMWRLLALGAATLRSKGVADPSRQLLCVHLKRAPELGRGIGTMLLAKTPPSAEAVHAWVRKMEEMAFTVDLAPGTKGDDAFERIARTGDASAIGEPLGIDLSPPTDDRPFYFYMRPFTNFFRPGAAEGDIAESRAGRVLSSLLVVTVVLAALFIGGPLWALRRREAVPFRGRGVWLLFFVSIGVAYMLVEISQMQRLILFLGHPIYGLSVVLAGLLVSSGLGSFASGALARTGRPPLAAAFVPLLLLLGAFGLFAPGFLASNAGQPTSVRIAVSLACLAPMGFFMGFPFPLAMGMAGARAGAPLAWFYGVNGAASVCASVVSMALSLTFGIAAAFWTGVAFYAAAWGLLAIGRRG